MKRLLVDHVLIAVGTAVILCIGLSTAAAQEVKIRGASSGSSLPQLGGLASVQPKPLSAAQKLQAIQSVVSRQGKKAGSLVSPLLLSPGKLTAGPARLMLHSPNFVEASSGVPRAIFDNNNGKVIVTFTPPATGLYLVEYTIDGKGPFTMSGQNTMQSSSKVDVSGHLLFVSHFTQTTSYEKLILEAPGGWYFYSCEISQIK